MSSTTRRPTKTSNLPQILQDTNLKWECDGYQKWKTRIARDVCIYVSFLWLDSPPSQVCSAGYKQMNFQTLADALKWWKTDVDKRLAGEPVTYF